MILYSPHKNNCRPIIATNSNGDTVVYETKKECCDKLGITPAKLRECIRKDSEWEGYTFKEKK